MHRTRLLCMNVQVKYLLQSKVCFSTWSSDKAYWLGYLYGNGSIDESMTHLNLHASYLDHKHINENLLPYITSSFKIYNDPQETQLISNLRPHQSIFSQEMAKYFVKIGMQEIQTRRVEWPKYLPNIMYNHFIRGYFDARGVIRFVETQENVCLTFRGSMQFLEKLQTNINENIQQTAKGSLSQRNEAQKSCVLQFGGIFSTKTVIEWMYQQSNDRNRLFRKWVFCKEILKCSNFPKHQRKWIMKQFLKSEEWKVLQIPSLEHIASRGMLQFHA